MGWVHDGGEQMFVDGFWNSRGSMWDILTRLQPLIGLVGILGVAYLLSTNRRAISPRVVGWGLGLQFLFALIVVKTDVGIQAFSWLGDRIQRLLAYSVGARVRVRPARRRRGLVEGHERALGAEGGQYAVIFAFQILPTIIFIAALFAMLYYFGVMQIIVRLFAVVMNRVMGASGAESLNVAASIFMGQTEAPLTIRPFLPRMTQSELMTVMTSGMAHISGGIMAAYIAFGIEAEAPADGGDHDRARHADDGEDVRAGNRDAGDAWHA